MAWSRTPVRICHCICQHLSLSYGPAHLLPEKTRCPSLFFSLSLPLSPRLMFRSQSTDPRGVLVDLLSRRLYSRSLSLSFVFTKYIPKKTTRVQNQPAEERLLNEDCCPKKIRPSSKQMPPILSGTMLIRRTPRGLRGEMSSQPHAEWSGPGPRVWTWAERSDPVSRVCNLAVMASEAEKANGSLEPRGRASRGLVFNYQRLTG